MRTDENALVDRLSYLATEPDKYIVRGELENQRPEDLADALQRCDFEISLSILQKLDAESAAYLLIELDHSIFESGYLHVPRAQRFIDDRRVGSPTVRVIMQVGFVAQYDAPRLQIFNDLFVGIEYLLTLIVWDLTRESTSIINWAKGRNPVCGAHDLIVFAETWSHVHDTRTIFG